MQKDLLLSQIRYLTPPHQVDLKEIKSASNIAIQPHLKPIYKRKSNSFGTLPHSLISSIPKRKRWKIVKKERRQKEVWSWRRRKEKRKSKFWAISLSRLGSSRRSKFFLSSQSCCCYYLLGQSAATSRSKFWIEVAGRGEWLGGWRRSVYRLNCNNPGENSM